MKKKIFELSETPDLKRREFWQKEFPGLCDYEFVDANPNEEELKAQWKTIFSQSSAMLIDQKHSTFLLKIMPQTSRRLLETHRIDSMFKDAKNNAWPQCLLREALHELIVKTAPHLDTSGVGYVTGACPMMRTSVSVLVQLGFRKLYVVVRHDQAASEIEATLRKLYFDTEIHVINHVELPLHKNNGSILINTFEFSGNKELAEDLSYLNFIFAGGLVIDTCHRQIRNPLLDEAIHVGLQNIHGGTLQGAADWHFVHQLLSVPLGQAEYTQKWLQVIGAPAADEGAEPKNPPKVQ
jgi:hypothetical protein